MSMDRDGSEKSVTEQEGQMFAAKPIWEQRGRKRGAFGFGRKTAAAASPAPMVAPEPRSFAAERDYEEPMALDRPIDRPVERPMDRETMDQRMADRAAAADAYAGAGYMAAPAGTRAGMAEEADSGMVAPIGRTSTRASHAPRSKGIGPAAIAAGVVALGAIGAAGWYASRDSDGIPELAPGQPAGEMAAAAALPPVAPPATQASADTTASPPATAAPPRATVRATAPVRTAQATRTRPAAAAPSAAETGVNASTTTTLPAGPQPYSTLNPGAAPPAPVNPPTTTMAPTPPTQAAPPPAESPAAAPATPPTLPSQATPPTDPAPEPPSTTPPTS